MGRRRCSGVGGTRNCDWWFTEDAVLIDTAGRYTTQDSHAAVDAAAWLGFLRLLKKHRRRQPLNGVLVAICLSDLSILNEEERLAHARAVRRRVRELHDELGVRVPVYVLFTKADLIAGFVEFFDSLGREERDQAWGVTFPYEGKDENGPVAGFPARVRRAAGAAERSDAGTGEPGNRPARRRLIYGFPQQFASLRDVANEFLAEAFRPCRLEARAAAARYLCHVRHAGRHADRPAAGAMAGPVRPAAPVRQRVQRHRAQLFPGPADPRGDLRRGRAGWPGPQGRAAAAPDAYRPYAAAAVLLLPLTGGREQIGNRG